MSESRDLFSTSVLPDQTELKANAALYAARESVGTSGPAEAQIITSTPRAIQQRGAEAARVLREQLIAEHKAVVVEAAARFARRDGGGIPSRSILRFRLSDLPGLMRPGRGPDAPKD